MSAALRRRSLKAAVGLAPFSPSQTLNNLRVPTMLLAGQNDGTTTPASIVNHYNAIPSGTEKAYLELSGAGHGFPTSNNSTMMRNVIPWLKIFIDSDTRYTQFLCPLGNSNGIRSYQSSCPLVPSPVPTTSPTTPPPGGACGATYRTVNTWPSGFQGEVTVTAGSSAINGWTVGWSLGAGQTVNQVWNGTVSTSGASVSVSVRNVSYNGLLPPSGSTTFGFIGGGAPTNPTLTCV
jgi:hypothetical protein